MFKMARVSPYSTTELAHPDANLLSFPEKLWWIVNNPKRGEIHWSTHGTSIVIPSTQRFVAEVLNNPSSALFKTKNFASFVRQLNLYGFRKVTEYPRRTPPSTLSLSSRCEFKHPFFRKGRRGKEKQFFVKGLLTLQAMLVQHVSQRSHEKICFYRNQTAMVVVTRKPSSSGRFEASCTEHCLI